MLLQFLAIAKSIMMYSAMISYKVYSMCISSRIIIYVPSDMNPVYSVSELHLGRSHSEL